MNKILIFLAALIFLSACGKSEKEIITPSGLKYIDLKEGTGASPVKGQTAKVYFIGKLENGRVFDSAVNPNKPLEFKIGANEVIPGWEEGVMSMKVGGKRKLIIPASLAWGKEGANGVIPPDATVIFEIELLEVK
jgi:peptidylprolyl isomerase